MNNLSTNTKEYWNDEYNKASHIYGLEPSKTALEAVELLLKKNLKRANKKLELLEIGGGYGRNAIYFNKMGINVSVVDFSDVAIKQGRKLNHVSRCSVEFIEEDIKKLKKIFKKKRFDVIFCNFCMHLISKKNRECIYEQIRYVLKPHGFFIASYLSINDPDYLDNKRIDDQTRVVRNKSQHFFTKPEIERELQKNFFILKIKESNDPEKIINCLRNTSYFFVVGSKR